MNHSKVWLVVSPSVGVPLFLGSVAVAALIVHGALMIKTDWFGAYWNGGSLRPKAVATAPAPVTTAAAPTAPTK